MTSLPADALRTDTILSPQRDDGYTQSEMDHMENEVKKVELELLDELGHVLDQDFLDYNEEDKGVLASQ